MEIAIRKFSEFFVEVGALFRFSIFQVTQPFYTITLAFELKDVTFIISIFFVVIIFFFAFKVVIAKLVQLFSFIIQQNAAFLPLIIKVTFPIAFIFFVSISY